MPFEAVDHLTIDGYRYHFNNFRRFSIPLELPQLQAVRVQPPNIDAEVQGFDGGLSPQDLDATGSFYRDAVGMEPTGPVGAITKRALKVGRSIVPVDSSGATGLTGLSSLVNGPGAGALIAGAATNGNVYQYVAGGTPEWSLLDAVPAGAVTKILNYKNGVVVYNATNANWSYTAGGLGALVDLTITATGNACYDAVVGYTNGVPIIYRVVDVDSNTTGFVAGVRSTTNSDSTVETFIGPLKERNSRGGAVAGGGNVYVCGAQLAPNYTGTVYQISGGGLQDIVTLSDNYMIGGAWFHGAAYFAAALGGRLYRLNGNTLELVQEFPLPNVSADDLGRWAIKVWGGSLYVIGEDSNTANRIRVWRSDDGVTWSSPYYHDTTGGAITSVNDIAVSAEFISGLMIAVTSAATGQIAYQFSSGFVPPTARLEFPDVVYGTPAINKSYIHGRLNHSPLLSGQSVRLTHFLNNSTVETTDGTNSNVGSVETIIPFPVETVGTRLRPRWNLTAASASGTSQQLTVYSGGVRAAPLPVEREVWTADLMLTNSLYNDGTSDSRDALEKYERLLELKRSGRTFQAIDPFRESSATTLPRSAMMAKIDAQLPLEWEAQQLASNQGGAFITVPIRFSQVYGDVVGPLNFDFENDAAGATAITGWTYSATTSSGSASISTAVNTFRTGSKSIALTFSGTPTLFNISQTITGLVGGRYYTVGGYLKRQMSAGVACIEVSSTGLGVRTDEIASATDTEFDWYERTFQLPIANSAVTVRIGATGTPAGTLWADGVRVIE